METRWKIYNIKVYSTDKSSGIADCIFHLCTWHTTNKTQLNLIYLSTNSESTLCFLPFGFVQRMHKNRKISIVHTYNQHNWDAPLKCPCTISQHDQTDKGTHWDVLDCMLSSQLLSCNTVDLVLLLPSSDSVSLLSFSLLPPGYPTLRKMKNEKMSKYKTALHASRHTKLNDS